MSAKPGRNQPCPCGSGIIKYKFCCIGKELRPRIVTANRSLNPSGAPAAIDLTNDVMNHISGLHRELHHFCKDNGIYLFGSTLRMREAEIFETELKAGILTKCAIIENYKNNTKQDVVLAWLDDACATFPSFGPRLKILRDAVNVHYQGTYTLSVPVLFAQIEGILWHIGALTLKDGFRPTIKRDWNSRTLFVMSDNAEMFNAFLHNLYEGQKNSTDFNRNPILHGTNVSYDSEEYSLILILTILEIRMFLWFEKTRCRWSDLVLSHPNRRPLAVVGSEPVVSDETRAGLPGEGPSGRGACPFNGPHFRFPGPYRGDSARRVPKEGGNPIKLLQSQKIGLGMEAVDINRFRLVRQAWAGQHVQVNVD